ncbi:hypothetical protein ES703_114583 [subsurface metagenome]
MQLVMVGEESQLSIPPPELLKKVQFITVGGDLWLCIPPPQPMVDELFESIQLVTIAEE